MVQLSCNINEGEDKMINITKHCLDRYAERILGIEDLQTARQYINSNQDKINEDIDKLFTYATLIYTGQIGGDKSSKNYWLRDNIVMVTDTGNSTLITLYRIDFGLGETIDKLVTDKLLEEINELNKDFKEAERVAVEEIDGKQTDVININAEIEKYKQMLANLQLRKETVENEIKIVNQKSQLIYKEIETRALKICNSAEYRKDLLKLNAGK